MARQTVRIGSMVDISAYDDGDFDSAIETTQPIKAGAPIDGNDVVRLDDLILEETIITLASRRSFYFSLIN